MSFRRSDGPADRAESERLLNAAWHGRPPAAEADPLRHLLAAAAAPANPGEMSGEEQALAAFRAARAAPATASAPAPSSAPRRRRLRVGAAAWVAGLAATATAGVAFAAVSLDRPEQPTSPPAPTTPGSSSASPSRTASADPTGGPTATPSAGSGPATTGGPGRPAGVAQLTGLCRAYLAKSASQRARALETPAFADLVAAAGGAARVEAYCDRLVPEKQPKASPDARPTRSTGPASAPTAASASTSSPARTPAAGRTGKPSTGADG
ncbi:hypothetical protein [Micromonospora inositola]|uniref:hypothetical protein n=1 Tax=Micromonospora inositola TaxID=47865 RepID=UPI000B5AD012|nr:hypothetical protein [Micromonospora inositola]